MSEFESKDRERIVKMCTWICQAVKCIILVGSIAQCGLSAAFIYP